MASWATLASSTAYLTLLAQINDRDVDAARAFDPAHTSVTSPVTNAVRYNSANKRWELYNGSAWAELIAAASDAFSMSVTGLRSGTLYGNTTNGGTLSGGTVDVTTLKQAGSAAWTAATLTNLSQLSNGPGYITSAALSGYAPLAAPALTGVPTAPTAVTDTNTTQLATTAFVVGQSYLKSATAAATYAALTGAQFTDDLRTYRIGAPTTGYAWFGNSGTKYFGNDGTNWLLATNDLKINGSLALHASNYNNYAPTKTGGGASGTWGINITGNAATATTATSATTATNVSGGGTVAAASAAFSGVAIATAFVASSGSGGRTEVVNGNSDHTGYLSFYNIAGTREGYIGFASTTGGSDGGTIPFTMGTAAFTGNVTAASFSGPLTGNVTGNVSGSSGSCTGNAATATSAAAWTTARNLTIGSQTQSVNGSAAVTWTLPSMGAQPTVSGNGLTDITLVTGAWVPPPGTKGDIVGIY